MSRPWILVAPSKTGIGYALTRHLLLNTHPSIPILAAGMDKTSEKTSLFEELPDRTSLRDRLHALPLDMTSESTIASVSRRAASLFPPETHHLHLAFCLPNRPSTSNPDPEERNSKVSKNPEESQATDAFKHNTIFPMMMMKHFGPFLPDNKHKQPLLQHASAAEDNSEWTRIIQAAEDDTVENHPPSTWAGSAGGYGGPGEPKLYQSQPEQANQDHDQNPPSIRLGSAGGYGGPGESDPYLESQSQSQTYAQPQPDQPTENQTPAEDSHESESEPQFQTLPPHAIWTNLSVHTPTSAAGTDADPSEHLNRASRCASHSLTRSFDDQLRHQKAQALAVSYTYSMNPGLGRVGGDGQSENWTNSTDGRLFTPNLRDARDAAAKMANVIFNMKASQRGRTWNSKGEEEVSL